MKNTPATTSPSWTLSLDKVQDWAWAENVLSDSECDAVIEYGKNLYTSQAVLAGGNVDLEYRDSNVSWISPTQEIQWLYRKMTDFTNYINSQHFNFDLFGFTEPYQFTEYKSPGGKYNFHMDKNTNGILRKLTIVIQLTEPENYTGGELQIYRGDTDITTMQKTRGMAFVFPSWMIHRVTPVETGTRYSLVSWISGPQFK